MEVHLDAGPSPGSNRCPSGASTGARRNLVFARLGPVSSSALVVVLALYLLPIGSHSADLPANAPTDEQLGAALAAAEKLLELG